MNAASPSLCFTQCSCSEKRRVFPKLSRRHQNNCCDTENGRDADLVCGRCLFPDENRWESPTERRHRHIVATTCLTEVHRESFGWRVEHITVVLLEE